MNFEINEDEIPISELLLGCIEGKRKSWDCFFEKFHKLITGVVNHKISDNPEDIIQLIYLRLVENDYNVLRKFKGTNYGSFFLYLKEVSKNVVREEYKKNTIKDKVIDPYKIIEENIVDPVTISNGDSKEDLSLLLDKIMDLDILFREVLTLRFLGYKTREIAEILNIPLNTVLTRTRRAIKKLKKNSTKGIKSR